MKFFATIVSKLSPKRDPAVLYVTIDELPNPRDWGTLDLMVGNKLIFNEDVDLAAPNTKENWGQIPIFSCHCERSAAIHGSLRASR